MFATRIATLTLAFLSISCSPAQQSIDIPFAASFAGHPIDCHSDPAALSDLRFYVTDIQLIALDGAIVDGALAAGVALIDLEDGAGNCLNGTPEMTSRVQVMAPAGEYRGLNFVIGVPFALNHLNPLTAEPPLDDADMHWHWRSGYKFLRAGMRSDEDGFWMHLGSAGCEGTVGNISACRFPNRVKVSLPEFQPGLDSINIDLSELLRGTDLDDNAPSDCSSGPPETACDAPFANLGINFKTGEQSDDQRVFSTQ